MKIQVLQRIPRKRQSRRNEIIVVIIAFFLSFLAIYLTYPVILEQFSKLRLFFENILSFFQTSYCCKINIQHLSNKTLSLKADGDYRNIIFSVTNENNKSIVGGLVVKCQAVLPNGEQTDRIIVEPKEIQIEPLGYRGTSREYGITVRTHNTPPGKYIVRLQAAYSGKPQSGIEEITVYVKH